MNLPSDEEILIAAQSNPDDAKIVYTFYNAEHQECNDSSAVTYVVTKYDNCGKLTEETKHDVDENMRVGPTPAGGVFSRIYFFDSAGNACDAEKAVRAIGVEFDRSGNRIKETYLTRHGEPSRPRRDRGLFGLFRKKKKM